MREVDCFSVALQSNNLRRALHVGITMKLTLILLLTPLLISCATSSKRTDNKSMDRNIVKELPGDTFANFSPSVKIDLIKNITTWVKTRNCSEFSVTNTSSKNIENENIIVNERRQLIKGVLSETWEIDYCNLTSNIGLIISPDGLGGTLVAIAEL